MTDVEKLIKLNSDANLTIARQNHQIRLLSELVVLMSNHFDLDKRKPYLFKLKKIKEYGL